MTSDNKPSNFLQQIITKDLEEGKCQEIVTRFPPEPNGFLHIGHAKAISVNFGFAEEFSGRCNLRFDDTNPAKEDQVYVDAIQEDIKWLGYSWDGDVKYASSYFDQLYEWAVYLIKEGKAFVCELNDKDPALKKEYKGDFNVPGKNSPYRDRSVEENLALFEKMRAGEFDEGHCVLRAKIDMAHGNMNMRDPILYRIVKKSHHQTGDKWCIYPTYDFAHGQEDAIEGVTHSLCSLEFSDHRPLYDWFIENLPIKELGFKTRPYQTEFARLNPTYTITSKRKLKKLVDEGHVDGWDDPRMPTIAGYRRRGYTPHAIRTFCQMVGLTRANSSVDISMLEYAIRDDLDKNAPRAMCVLNPLKVVLTNYPGDKTEEMSAPGHPNRDDLGQRTLPFGREIFIDADDYREEANKKYKRLVKGKRVRLRNAYVIEADEDIKDESGNIIEVRARIIEGTVGNNPEDGVKPKGVIQWVAAHNCAEFKVNLYDRLFTQEFPEADGQDFIDAINPDSLVVLENCKGEKGLLDAEPEKAFQFEREGYFCRDSKAEGLVFNRTIGLKDTWAKTGE